MPCYTLVGTLRAQGEKEVGYFYTIRRWDTLYIQSGYKHVNTSEGKLREPKFWGEVNERRDIVEGLVLLLHPVLF